MKNKKIKIIISVICVIVLFAVTSIVSLTKFNTPNSVAVAFSVTKLYITDAEYVEIQNAPRIVISERGDMNGFFEALEEEGYTHLEDEQMGSMCFFEKDGQKEAVMHSGNKFYSLWTWQ